MIRRLLNLLTILSLLLCVAAVAMWVTGYRWGTSLTWTRGDPVGTDQGFLEVSLLSERGEAAAVIDREWAHCDQDVGPLLARAEWPSRLRWGWRPSGGMFDHLTDSDIWPTAGFAAVDNRTELSPQDGSRYTVLMAPWWAAAAAFAVLPTIRLSRRLWRRRKAGSCPTCGYDLRATPGRCPECGTRAPG
jgi:hypothetical protein